MIKRWLVVLCVWLMGPALLAQAVQVEKAKPMAADADLSFEVASVKPNGGAPFSLVNLEGGRYTGHNVSLNDLVKFAYRLNQVQVSGMPAWGMQERYDIEATAQPEGTPNGDQLRTMLQKLLAERFALKAHTERKELNIFVMTVEKSGPRMKVSESEKSGDSDHEVPGGLALGFHGYTMQGLAQMLQQAVLGRPVMDQTGLTGRYDFDVTFLPDPSMFGGRVHFPPDLPNAAPSLFTALEDLGLKLTAEKTQADVLVIDGAARPTAN